MLLLSLFKKVTKRIFERITNARTASGNGRFSECCKCGQLTEMRFTPAVRKDHPGEPRCTSAAPHD